MFFKEGAPDFIPPPGGWTGQAGLGTEDIDFDDSISPTFFELEREAVFKRSWLHVGRESDLPEPGSYFTKEMPAANTSIIVVRGKDGKIRAFHNMCGHRGNKLVWDGSPAAETCGEASDFQCRYHGWRYNLDGSVRSAAMANWFFDFDRCRYALAPVHCEVWETFIFVNFAPEPSETLSEALGDLARGLEGYPFDRMTQSYKFRCDVRANWKIFEDAFQEQYHGTILHYKIIDQTADAPPVKANRSHFEFFGRNSIWSVAAPQSVANGAFRPLRPAELNFRGGLFGPWQRPADLDLDDLPKYVNPTGHPNWTNDLYHFYPNFEIMVWERGWILTYNYWPVAVDRMVFEGRLYFPTPKTAGERLAQELTAAEFKEFCLQDASTLEAAQMMLTARPGTTFPISDEEVQVRNNRRSIRDAVAAYQREQAAGVGR